MYPSNRFTLVLLAAIVAVGAVVLLRDTETSELTRGADVAVSCGASQRALVRQTVASGTPHVDIRCVDEPSRQTASYVVDERGRVVRVPDSGEAAGVPAAQVVPATIVQAMSPAVFDHPAPAPMVQRVAAPPAQTRSGPTHAAPRQPSTWRKRALVIGGSAGAGAGGLAGGKKGALIGAAIGGGGAALFEALKGE
jgi:hypothetical protein